MADHSRGARNLALVTTFEPATFEPAVFNSQGAEPNASDPIFRSTGA